MNKKEVKNRISNIAITAAVEEYDFESNEKFGFRKIEITFYTETSESPKIWLDIFANVTFQQNTSVS